MTLVREDPNGGQHVLWLGELAHRGHTIRNKLDARRGFRRRRRSQLRHRPARFNNRTRPKGWLAPSLQHRVDTTLACHACNQAKGYQRIEAFLSHDPKRLAHITAQAKAPLKDAAALSGTRWALYGALRSTGRPIETASGGRTKYNRNRLHVPRSHCLDAACVGVIERVTGWQRPFLGIKATGRGSYQRTRLDRYGFPRGYLTRRKRQHGYQTGDFVRSNVPFGRKAGTHVGRVAVRASGSFNIQTPQGVVQCISRRHFTWLQRSDGYGYHFFQPKIAPHPTEEARTGATTVAALSLSGLNAGVSRANG